MNETRTAPTRRYDKGERRYKHVGRGPKPAIEFTDGNPKMWVGKCPATLDENIRQTLLDEAIAAPNGDRDLVPAKKVYVVHEGAVYEAQTSDRGRSYHGYPYKGKLSAHLLTDLRAMATRKNCVNAFDEWVGSYIEQHGARR